MLVSLVIIFVMQIRIKMIINDDVGYDDADNDDDDDDDNNDDDNDDENKNDDNYVQWY